MTDNRPEDAIKTQILALLARHPERAYRPKELSQALNIKNHGRYQALLDTIDALKNGAEVLVARGGRLQHRPPSDAEAVGRMSVNEQGFGFVKLEDGTELFVRATRMGTALDGDLVRVALAAEVRGKRDPDHQLRQAEVIEVVERGKTKTVGSFSQTGKSGWVKPDDNRLQHDIFVARDAWNGAVPGDKVVVSIDSFDDPKAAPEGRVLEILGQAGAPGVDVLALAMALGAPSDFPDAVEKDASRIQAGITAAEVGRRRDLRDLTIFTIDPPDAKDFDDAIHTRDLGDGLTEVGVHIADVSFYVEQGSALDKEAYDRATSTYLVDRVIPMLPEALSNGVCSLRPKEDKLAYSCLLVVDRTGEVRSAEIFESVIHSVERFTYDGAQDVLDGASHALQDEVLRAGALARTLTARRMREGAIDFDVPEVRVVLDEKGTPIDIITRERREANRLVEEFMLLANRAVALAASKRQTPLMYRIHDKPDRERIEALAEYVAPFGYSLPHSNGAVPREALNKLLRSVKGKPEAPVIEQVAIRSMAKAVYSPHNIGHFGLGFDNYAHFTSPIRRYPDLIVHRTLKRMLGQAGGKLPTTPELELQAQHCSDREREATTAERESIKLKQVEYAAQRLGDTFDGVVVGVTKFGVFVEMSALLTQGLVHVREMTDDYWEYDAARYSLVGRSSRRRIKVGDPCSVQIAAAEPETRRIDLLFTEAPGQIADSRQVKTAKAQARRKSKERKRR